MICMNCGNKIPANNTFCGNCGAEISRNCTECGSAVPPANKFCGGCGRKIGGTTLSRAKAASSHFSDSNKISKEPELKYVTDEVLKLIRSYAKQNKNEQRNMRAAYPNIEFDYLLEDYEIQNLLKSPSDRRSVQPKHAQIPVEKEEGVSPFNPLIGKWQEYNEGYNYEVEITEYHVDTNVFSNWQKLFGKYSIEGNKLHFKGISGWVNDGHPRFAEIMRNNRGHGLVEDLQYEEAIFEYTLSDGKLQLRWIDGTVLAPQELNLSKVFMLKSEASSGCSGGCFGVLMSIVLLSIGLLSIMSALY